MTNFAPLFIAALIFLFETKVKTIYAAVPDLCEDPKMDAITKVANGNTYIFKGDYYWKLGKNGLADGYPRLISTDWHGLPGHLNAALILDHGRTFFFKGNKYWRFRNMEMDDGYPKNIEVGFPGMPENVDAVINWVKNGNTYFFKGNGYWRLENSTEHKYPLSIRNEWRGIPNNLDAAFTNDNTSYFFKGDQYYRLNDNTGYVTTAEAYPRKTAFWWYNCNDLCKKPKIDTITQIANGNTYVFKGDYYWKLEDNGLADRYSRLISEDWDGLPGNLNAALNWRDGTTYFFKGNKYWRFRNMKMEEGYPKNIAVGFPGMPENVDAVLHWKGNNKTYFFKGNGYWRLEDRNEHTYPLSIGVEWNGIPNNLDAAFTYNHKTYFFKGDVYYKFNDITNKVESNEPPPYPRKTTNWWYGCNV